MVLRSAAAFAALALVAGLGACGSIPFSGEREPPTTAALPKAPADSPLAADDMAALARSADAAIAGRSRSGPDWANARSGVSGTFAFLAPEPSGSGACRPFASEVSSVSGVHVLRGVACDGGGGVAIRDLRPAGEANG